MVEKVAYLTQFPFHFFFSFIYFLIHCIFGVMTIITMNSTILQRMVGLQSNKHNAKKRGISLQFVVPSNYSFNAYILLNYFLNSRIGSSDSNLQKKLICIC